MDNVTLSLNLVDHLSGEDSLLDIRNRRNYTAPWRNSNAVLKRKLPRTIQEAESSIQAILQDEKRKLNEALADVQNSQGSDPEPNSCRSCKRRRQNCKKYGRKRELRQSTNVAIKDAERQRDREIREKQRSIQRLSVFVPPLPLLLIAIFVFYKKRGAEIQGAIDSRVRS